MVHISQEQIINDDELGIINTLSFNSTLYKSHDRKYSSYKFTDKEKDIFLKKLLIWVESIVDFKFNNYKNYMFDCFLIVYNVGDYFLKHSDDMYMINKGSNRKYVAGFHINNNYEGGEYNVYNHDTQFETIINKPGFTYLFDSSMFHEVKIVKKGIRKSVVIFIDEECIENRKKII